MAVVISDLGSAKLTVPGPDALLHMAAGGGPVSTGGAVSAIVLRNETGINRGFDFWDDAIDLDPNYLSLGRAQRSGDGVPAASKPPPAPRPVLRPRIIRCPRA